jgi:hypothetical protein
MSRTATLTSRALTVASLVMAAVAFSIAAPEPAQAAGEYGFFKGAEVYCNGYFNNNLEVTARFARNSGFSSQWIAYTHYVKNIDTGQITKLLVNNSEWFMVNHYQPFNGLLWATHNMTQTWNYALPKGTYKVFTKYSWYSGYWVTTGWIEASFYNSYGYSTTTDCKLRA